MGIMQLPSVLSFLGVFDKFYGHIKFLKQTVLGRCDFCMSILMQKKKITNDSDLAAFQEACRLHWELHTGEWISHSNRVHVSKTQPDKVLHLVFDCPDGYDIPSIVPIMKETANLPKITVNAVGTINHTTLAQDYMFFTDVIKKNPNLILTVFYLHIVHHLENSTEGHPPIL